MIFELPLAYEVTGNVSTQDISVAINNRMSQLLNEAPKLASAYQKAQPFPHIALDNFLPLDVMDALNDCFPEAESNVWTKLPTDDQRGKWAANDEACFPPQLRSLVHELNSSTFLKFLEIVTGIDDLIVDAKLSGGGLHRIEQGGKLSVHLDFSHNPSTRLNRRLNLLLYFNKDWREEYGGNLELWRWGKASDERRAEVKILPVYNRCAIFSTSPISWHGHPDPLTCPPGMARNSLALYYFSNGRASEEGVEHNTLFRSTSAERPSLGTRFVRLASSGVVKDIMPPVLHRALRGAWNRKGGSEN
ncbi:2OG-Fe(II) oxygenase [Litorisediminicola beolgyonensis]|uniref:2OG-Fe(II) oxygenase n=1 Tax=Litorisediminicola beolgyonensis TaxID=1173614 RepID=A0ABW3ZNV2_9RHOB